MCYSWLFVLPEGACLKGGRNLKQVNELIKEMNKGKKLDENIPMYSQTLLEVYQKSALLHVTLDYYTLYETILETDKKGLSEIQETLDRINEVIKIIFTDRIQNISIATLEQCINKLKEIRQENTDKMQILTAFADKMQIYEHTLNRMELKYKDNVVLSDEIEFMKKVLRYIFEIKDNMIINDRIKEMIGQLPIRMARSYYFQLIANSLSVYTGGDKTAVDNFIYMLETSAMLYKPNNTQGYFLDIANYIESLNEIIFSELDEKEYSELVIVFKDRAKEVLNISDNYMELQGIVNQLYAFVLTLLYNKNIQDEKMITCCNISKELYQCFLNCKWEEVTPSITKQLIVTEGIQEELYDSITKLETVFQKIWIDHNKKLEEINQEEKFRNLNIIQQLVSSSRFIELEKKKTEEIATEEYIEERTQEILEKLSQQFKSNQMCINRAVIANTISKLPVFFNSTDEVKDYIENALHTCQDIAEKQACITMIEEIIDENNAFFTDRGQV